MLEVLLGNDDMPEDWQQVDNTFIVEKLIEHFPYAKLYISDRYYWVCPKQTIRDFLAMDDTDKEKYIYESHDCDDFSFRLMGQFHKKPYSALAFGIAWSNVHAYNVVVVTEEGVFLVEPQTDALIPFTDDEAYNTVLIII